MLQNKPLKSDDCQYCGEPISLTGDSFRRMCLKCSEYFYGIKPNSTKLGANLGELSPIELPNPEGCDARNDKNQSL